jgi:4-amino-4-deoxy-L-arabinose transferase-like glycosyltransferase
MLGSVAFTFLTGERLAGYWRGFAAGLFYVCSAGAFLEGRTVTPEPIFALFVTAAIYCAVRGYQHQKFRAAWFGACWLGVALASLTKGPLAALLLALVLAALAMFFREARLRFRPLLHWPNLLLFVVIVAPWYVWAARNYPGFLSYYFNSNGFLPNPSRRQFLLDACVWSCPGILLVLPALLSGGRRIFRPSEFAFADALPIAWCSAALLLPLVAGARHTFSAFAAMPAVALFAAWAWERASRALRSAGVVLALVAGFSLAGLAYFAPGTVANLLGRSVDGGLWSSLAPLIQIAVGSLAAFGLGALLTAKQRGEITLVVILGAMVPIGFCLVEARSRVAPWFSLADAAQFLNPRLAPATEVIYEGRLSSGNSLSFYLGKKFFLVNQAPTWPERAAASQNKYLDEHFVLEAWDGSNPRYLIIAERRGAYWRQLIVNRVHIYHQVTTCGSRVILSNQM